ncbi:UDP-N-acetylglucosamine 2-epimerase (hydrolyzing) [Adhaeribacter swui]|uniref:UDP-N-acetylglucosamine 2-epimerase (Hydrolyzing) n=1 Tax=Adhaeribacter swui TaxID=2086471 RepID=A0A7G7G9H3_9BACT|nr:UDP-N-acetylglucosamine 2-epimerase [Adhaeribacter swui]QNF33807.1 UDP-N-acetylglucosamine 2-epimerase (hydrolyzing) [Adhaeribacter swui]
MKRKIAVITGTRAEYGLLYWTLKALKEDDEIELLILVTGMHLSPEFGLTYRQIESDGFIINKKIETILSSDSSVGVGKAMGLGLISFVEAYKELKPDLILVLGDRFEIFSAVAAAMVSRIPVAHCHGGESTFGLIDEPIRHSITKMSHLHFTSTEIYRNRVIQLGENPARVWNVGALGIENINRVKLLNKEAFEESIQFQLLPRNLLITFHPVTLEMATAEEQFNNLLNALNDLDEVGLIFTKPNADTDGRVIINLIDQFVSENNQKSIAFTNLGQLRYLSALQFVDGVIGNSSSGLIEAPSFKVGTLNIGARQQGRIKATSVIDCEPTIESIQQGLAKLFTVEFKETLIHVENPYGSRNASEQIVPVLKSIELENLIKKQFYDIL